LNSLLIEISGLPNPQLCKPRDVIEHFKKPIVKEIVTKIFNAIYCLIILLFLLDNCTIFDIKSQALKTFVCFGVLFGTPITLIWNLVIIKTKTKRIVCVVFPTIILILVLFLGPVKVLFSSGAWQTQTVLYQNGHLTFKTVEFQMQNLGALGYNKRTVEVLYLTKLFMIVRPVPKDIDQRVEWVKVDKEINELGLKEP
jgi:hypothetical protein